MLIFKMIMKVQAGAPEDEEMKETFMKNAEQIINQGLEKMTVPDWKVEILDMEEEDC